MKLIEIVNDALADWEDRVQSDPDLYDELDDIWLDAKENDDGTVTVSRKKISKM